MNTWKIKRNKPDDSTTIFYHAQGYYDGFNRCKSHPTGSHSRETQGNTNKGALMSERALVGYSSLDLETERIELFFGSWKKFNQRFDRTIGSAPIGLHDRIGLFHAYLEWNATSPSSENLIV